MFNDWESGSPTGAVTLSEVAIPRNRLRCYLMDS